MPANVGVRYRINANDEIVFVDEAWLRFAAANDVEARFMNSVIGRSLWDFISDRSTRDLYKQIIGRVRDGGVAQFTLRCDGPTCRRVLEMVIHACENGEIEFATSAQQLTDRDHVALLDHRAMHSEALLRSCAWCNRIDVGNSNWVEVEEATDRLRLFELDVTPTLTHGICDDCLKSMTELLDAMPAGLTR